MKNSELIPQWQNFIESSETRAAFNCIVKLASELTGFECYPCRKGEVLDFRFYSRRKVGVQPFSFITNRYWLLFYFRPPAVKSNIYSLEDVRNTFKEVNVNKAGEWTVRLRNTEDVQRLWRILKIS